MKSILSALAAGLVFGLGLIVSGMVNPAKVLNFLDIAGQWDPSLAFVMAGAAGTVFIGYRFVLKRDKPLFEDRFTLPTATRIDARLASGAALFGVGWGLVGFCPGPALTALGTGAMPALIFTAAMLAGMAGWRWLVRN
ncbi:MAG: YeeE/YedE family protein [Oceanicaulis sp.]|uniref:YeeE/YedE family protein n=1 Tax=Glycocaulis sp. TaxID=1969725 RepID=UPI0025C4295C|nr:YeeE/YedE family protein [Glycocaulis sp.]MCC5980697.1 YeeE/YedE family protein [Oceanicaulis sp.]MCH8522243.1 YeeE/YedE family protein [Glycocaulis sp.]